MRCVVPCLQCPVFVANRDSRQTLPAALVYRLKMEGALVLALMRLREKMGLKPSRGSRATASNTGGNPSNRTNAGRSTQTFWKSVGEGGDHREAGNSRSAHSPFWGGDPRPRLIAFAETIRLGESALSPAVFDPEGGRRAKVRDPDRCGGGCSVWR